MKNFRLQREREGGRFEQSLNKPTWESSMDFLFKGGCWTEIN